MAIDTDWQYWNIFKNTDAALNYIGALGRATRGMLRRGLGRALCSSAASPAMHPACPTSASPGPTPCAGDIIGYGDVVYSREINTDLSIGFARVFETAGAAPWTATTDTGALLNQLNSHWNSQAALQVGAGGGALGGGGAGGAGWARGDANQAGRTCMHAPPAAAACAVTAPGPPRLLTQPRPCPCLIDLAQAQKRTLVFMFSGMDLGGGISWM